MGGRRKPNAKGKTRNVYNQKARVNGQGVDQILKKVRKSTGQPNRQLAYGFILSKPRLVKATGKIRGDKRRALYDGKARDMRAKNAEAAAKRRAEAYTQAKSRVADEAQKARDKHDAYFKYEYEDGVKRLRMNAGFNFTTKQKVVGAVGTTVLGLIATELVARKAREKRTK